MGKISHKILKVKIHESLVQGVCNKVLNILDFYLQNYEISPQKMNPLYSIVMFTYICVGIMSNRLSFVAPDHVCSLILDISGLIFIEDPCGAQSLPLKYQKELVTVQCLIIRKPWRYT